ncbi:uncharacterized protein BX663DRAFT_523401 [Cokeromyces recurvatus]|uniref:uncharacterized protein n=1 Tax=Cokeromyces recurvatus TaxID=90255 RepID=UPI0022204308|nr:uncharacterized protein BX663DRAFT_523401 [Cokeromyces recurvatus]KAI7898772.1 hypothetical protein BX663DRAFT_523401 [Cokeromyces recurvatus]
MSSYISNTKPTLFQVILNKLGIIELPLKVNCWYCCQDSYILPGSKNTSDHWYCYLCESTNARDKNGDIADPKHFEAYPENLKKLNQLLIEIVKEHYAIGVNIIKL